MGWRGFSNITPAKLNVLIALQKLQHADASPSKKDWHEHKNHHGATNNIHTKNRKYHHHQHETGFPDSWFLTSVAKEVVNQQIQHHLRSRLSYQKILEGAVCSGVDWAVLLREARGSDASQTSWFVIPSSGWQCFWFRLWFSIVRGLWLTCYGTSSSHWAKPQGDALQGIIPHSGDPAEVWSQCPDWSDRGAWPLVKGSQGYDSCSMRMMFFSCWQTLFFWVGKLSGQKTQLKFSFQRLLWVIVGRTPTKPKIKDNTNCFEEEQERKKRWFWRKPLSYFTLMLVFP